MPPIQLDDDYRGGADFLEQYLDQSVETSPSQDDMLQSLVEQTFADISPSIAFARKQQWELRYQEVLSKGLWGVDFDIPLNPVQQSATAPTSDFLLPSQDIPLAPEEPLFPNPVEPEVEYEETFQFDPIEEPVADEIIEAYTVKPPSPEEELEQLPTPSEFPEIAPGPVEDPIQEDSRQGVRGEFVQDSIPTTEPSPQVLEKVTPPPAVDYSPVRGEDAEIPESLLAALPVTKDVEVPDTRDIDFPEGDNAPGTDIPDVAFPSEDNLLTDSISAPDIPVETEAEDIADADTAFPDFEPFEDLPGGELADTVEERGVQSPDGIAFTADLTESALSEPGLPVFPDNNYVRGESPSNVDYTPVAAETAQAPESNIPEYPRIADAGPPVPAGEPPNTFETVPAEDAAFPPPAAPRVNDLGEESGYAGIPQEAVATEISDTPHRPVVDSDFDVGFEEVPGTLPEALADVPSDPVQFVDSLTPQSQYPADVAYTSTEVVSGEGISVEAVVNPEAVVTGHEVPPFTSVVADSPAIVEGGSSPIPEGVAFEEPSRDIPAFPVESIQSLVDIPAGVPETEGIEDPFQLSAQLPNTGNIVSYDVPSVQETASSIVDASDGSDNTLYAGEIASKEFLTDALPATVLDRIAQIDIARGDGADFGKITVPDTTTPDIPQTQPTVPFEVTNRFAENQEADTPEVAGVSIPNQEALAPESAQFLPEVEPVTSLGIDSYADIPTNPDTELFARTDASAEESILIRSDAVDGSIEGGVVTPAGEDVDSRIQQSPVIAFEATSVKSTDIRMGDFGASVAVPDTGGVTNEEVSVEQILDSFPGFERISAASPVEATIPQEYTDYPDFVAGAPVSENELELIAQSDGGRVSTEPLSSVGAAVSDFPEDTVLSDRIDGVTVSDLPVVDVLTDRVDVQPDLRAEGMSDLVPQEIADTDVVLASISLPAEPLNILVQEPDGVRVELVSVEPSSSSVLEISPANSATILSETTPVDSADSSLKDSGIFSAEYARGGRVVDSEASLYAFSDTSVQESPVVPPTTPQTTVPVLEGLLPQEIADSTQTQSEIVSSGDAPSIPSESVLADIEYPAEGASIDTPLTEVENVDAALPSSRRSYVDVAAPVFEGSAQIQLNDTSYIPGTSDSAAYALDRLPAAPVEDPVPEGFDSTYAPIRTETLSEFSRPSPVGTSAEVVDVWDGMSPEEESVVVSAALPVSSAPNVMRLEPVDLADASEIEGEVVVPLDLGEVPAGLTQTAPAEAIDARSPVDDVASIGLSYPVRGDESAYGPDVLAFAPVSDAIAALPIDVDGHIPVSDAVSFLGADSRQQAENPEVFVPAAPSGTDVLPTELFSSADGSWSTSETVYTLSASSPSESPTLPIERTSPETGAEDESSLFVDASGYPVFTSQPDAPRLPTSVVGELTAEQFQETDGGFTVDSFVVIQPDPRGVSEGALTEVAEGVSTNILRSDVLSQDNVDSSFAASSVVPQDLADSSFTDSTLSGIELGRNEVNESSPIFLTPPSAGDLAFFNNLLPILDSQPNADKVYRESSQGILAKVNASLGQQISTLDSKVASLEARFADLFT